MPAKPRKPAATQMVAKISVMQERGRDAVSLPRLPMKVREELRDYPAGQLEPKAMPENSIADLVDKESRKDAVGHHADAGMRWVGLQTAALILCWAVAVSALAPSAPRKRSVEMQITLPTGAAPRAIVPEDEGAIIILPNRTRVGFVPMVRNSDDAAVVVAIWDLDSVPIRQLGRVEVTVGGPAVHSDTSPSFRIRVLRVIKSK